MVLKKEFSFKGKSVEELRELSIEEFAKLCPSRARRSLLRGFDKKLLKKIEKADGKKHIIAPGWVHIEIDRDKDWID